MEESTKKNLHPKLLLLTASVILVCIVALVAQIPKKKPEPQIDVTTTLEKIVKTSDLSTAVFQYQGIVEIPNQKNLKKIDYYICYTASVYAGIDFSEVTFSENKETKTITATLPEVKFRTPLLIRIRLISCSRIKKPTISPCWTPHLRRVKPISGRNAPAKVLYSASHK